MIVNFELFPPRVTVQVPNGTYAFNCVYMMVYKSAMSQNEY